MTVSKQFKRPPASSVNAQPGEQVEQDQYYSVPDVYLSNGSSQFRAPLTPFHNVQPIEQIEQNGHYPASGMYSPNGTSQFRAPLTPFHDVQPIEQIEQNGHYPASGMYSPNGTPQFRVPPTPLPGARPATVDPRIRERVAQYAQWLQINNNLPVSPQTLQAYQDAALETRKVGKREVRTFAPFQERTSALQVITTNQITMLAMLAISWTVGLFFLHLAMFTIILGIITLLYICGFIASGILSTNSFSGSSGEKIDEEIISALDQLGVEWPSYTILCPLYQEVTIVPQFIAAINALEYPIEKLQVLFLTEENDNETRAALYSMPLPPGFTILTVPKGSPQTKPRACNFGLLQAKGQFIVIFDAEDKPEPSQLKKAVLTFANLGSEVACVQAKLNYYNSTQNLLTRWFTAEYSTWFDIMLPGLQRSGFSLPLGGTSNHFRTEVLRALGGWDAFNVTEDCDLGLRISHYGLKTAVLDSTTYEEAPSRLKTWLFQRSRWIKGYLQTYLVHMRHPVQTLRQGHLRKFFSLQLIVGAWTVVLFINPFMWALTVLYILFHPVQLYGPLFPGPILYMGVFCLIFGNFFYVYIHLLGCVRRKEYALMKWVLLIPLYWIMMSMSAYIAFYQLIVKPHYWEKTQHGNHLAPPTQAQAQRLAPAIGQDGRAVVVSMPTTRLFAVTIGRVFKQTATSNELGTTTQRVTAVRGTLFNRLGQRNVHRQLHMSRIRDLWFVATIFIACVVSIAACAYYFQQHEIIFYGDAISHMRIARSVFDSATPGLGQLGTVWLPLPHILMWPFIWNDFLWQTGLAGSFVSMPCYVITSIYIFLLVRRLTKNSSAGFIAALAFILNPTVLYLQSTPLSETVCMTTFAMSAYYFLCWVQEDRPKFLVLTAACTFLATLARYDGWALFVAFLVLVPFIGLLKRRGISRLFGDSILFLLLGGLGIALWLLWNAIIFGDPFYFKDNIYSSQSQQMQMYQAGHLSSYHNLLQSLIYYSVDSEKSGGIVLCLLATAGLLWFIWRRRRSVEALAVLIFLVPFAFYIVSLYTGQASIWIAGFNPPGTPAPYYNVRYGAQIVVSLSVLLVLPLQRWSSSSRKYMLYIVQCLLLLVIVAQYIVLSSQGIIVLKETIDTASVCTPVSGPSLYLAQHYNGGYILEYIHSTQEDPTVMDLDFKDFIWEGSNKLWIEALHNPADTVAWVLVNPTNSGDIVAQNIDVHSPSFLAKFALVAKQTNGVELYHRLSQPLTPVHPAPMEWNVPRGLCP